MGTLEVPVTNCNNLALNSLSNDLTAWRCSVISEIDVSVLQCGNHNISHSSLHQPPGNVPLHSLHHILFHEESGRVKLSE